MKKYLLTTFIICVSAVHAQVGINQNDPKATLDVTKSSKADQPDGILIPRVSVKELDDRDAIYNTDQQGTLVFVNDVTPSVPPKAKTSEITNTGIYYYDLSSVKWKPIAENIYGNGSFTPNPVSISITKGTDIVWTNYINYNYFELVSSDPNLLEFNFPKASDFKDKTIYLRNYTDADLSITANSYPQEFKVVSSINQLGYILLLNTGAIRIYSNGTRWYLMSGRLNAG